MIKNYNDFWKAGLVPRLYKYRDLTPEQLKILRSYGYNMYEGDSINLNANLEYLEWKYEQSK